MPRSFVKLFFIISIGLLTLFLIGRLPFSFLSNNKEPKLIFDDTRKCSQEVERKAFPEGYPIPIRDVYSNVQKSTQSETRVAAEADFASSTLTEDLIIGVDPFTGMVYRAANSAKCIDTLSGGSGSSSDKKIKEILEVFLRRHGHYFGSPDPKYATISFNTPYVEIPQVVNGLEVENGTVKLVVNDKITAVSGHWWNIPRELMYFDIIESEQVISSLDGQIFNYFTDNITKYTNDHMIRKKHIIERELVIFPDSQVCESNYKGSGIRLSWKLKMKNKPSGLWDIVMDVLSDSKSSHWNIYVDAVTGDVFEIRKVVDFGEYAPCY